MRRYGVNAIPAMIEGRYWNNSGKRQDERLLEISGTCGLFVDEVFRRGDYSFWLYHGNPIAAYDHNTGAWLKSSAGWKSVTTKERLNLVPDAWISQKNFVWYDKGQEFKDDGAEIQKRLGLSLYDRYDGWRGAYVPAFAVFSSSDTGTWSDSPCPSDIVEKELVKARALLTSEGIKTYIAHSVTTNVFCMKRHVIVRALDYDKAVAVANEKFNTGDYRCADRSRR